MGVAKTAVKIAYGVAALPVGLWCLFVLYGVAKQRYDGEAVGPLVPFLLVALLVPLSWIAGVAGSGMLARRGKRWLPWALGFLVPVVLACIYIGVVVVPSFIAYW